MNWEWDSGSHSGIQIKDSGIRKLKDELVWQPVKLGPSADGYGSGQLGELLEEGEYRCGFCSGTGEKPRGSKCSVCKGKGRVSVEPPAVRCAFCKGGGEEKARGNVTCTACRGKGVIHVEEPIELCAHCRGTGAEPSNKLVCVKCRGKGVVTVKQEEGLLGGEEDEADVVGSFVQQEPEWKVEEEAVHSASVSERECSEVEEKSEGQVNEDRVDSASGSERECSEVEEKSEGQVEEDRVDSASGRERECSEVEEKSEGQVNEDRVRSASGSEREALEVVKKSGQADAAGVARNVAPPISSGYAEQLCKALVKKGLLTRDRTLYRLTRNGAKALGFG